MTQANNYTGDLIDRYIYQVMKNLRTKNKNDIEEELRTLISDMLEDKANEDEPSQHAIDDVLKELGRPSDLAAKYSDGSNYLISPAIYPTYHMVMKIVLYATLFGIIIASVVSLFTASNLNWYTAPAKLFSDIFNGLLISFAYVTIIFVILERTGVRFSEKSTEWNPASLPAAPSRELEIPIRRPIANIVFSVIIAVILVVAPQIIGAYYIGDSTRVVPIFDMDVLRSVLPLFIVIISLGICKSIWEIVEQKISMRYAIFAAIVDVIQLIILITLLTKFPIWNSDFIEGQSILFHISGNYSYDELWSRLNGILIAIFAVIFILENTIRIYKAVRYGGGQGQD